MNKVRKNSSQQIQEMTNGKETSSLEKRKASEIYISKVKPNFCLG